MKRQPLTSPSDDEPSSHRLLNQESSSYYQKSICTILNAVIQTFGNILLPEELTELDSILKLPCDSQRLFFRLYLRKYGWFRISKLEYADIINLKDAVNQLEDHKVLETTDCASLQDLVSVLQLDELKQLAKTLKIKVINRKEELIDGIVAESKSKQSRIVFSSPGLISLCKSTDARLLALAKQACGTIVRITDRHIKLMRRVIGLFFLEGSVEEADNNNNLSTAILTDLNRRKYPPYTIVRSRPIFENRSCWMAYEDALLHESEVMESLTACTVEGLETVFDRSLARWTECLSRAVGHRLDSYFLQRYTAGWIYTRLLSELVTSFEKFRLYNQANVLLETLLGQNLYCLGRRGRWWERLVLNLSTHLSAKDEAAKYCEMALADENVRAGSRFSITRRLCKLRDGEFDLDAPPDVITIYADSVASSTTGKKLTYQIDDETRGSVEELALAHFKAEGWLGFHCESSIMTMLFTLIFWDILYSDQPDVYQTPYQSAPLDLLSDAFYQSRMEKLQARLGDVRTGAAPQIISDVYYPYYGCMALGCDWEAYSLSSLVDICYTLGGVVLAELLRYLCEDYKHSAHGMPDLLLYRADRTDHLLVEVKSTNDRLSDAQRNWNAIFRQAGVKFALCRVLSTSARLSG